MQVRPESANDVDVEVPTEVYGPPLVVARRIVYEVAPLLAVHETVVPVCVVPDEVTPVGAAGGVQVPAVGVTAMQVEGARRRPRCRSGTRSPGSSR